LQGYPVSPIAQYNWKWGLIKLKQELKEAAFRHWAATFAPAGRAPQVGETWRCPDMARSLQMIAESDGESFYRGELADTIAAFAAKTGGALGSDDLAQHRSE
jgi:gamma-glutamyltranspeptidase/glutathione hydrolase